MLFCYFSMKNHKILPAGSNSTRLFQMLAQQVGKQPRILVAGKNSPGGHIVSAALALIEGGVFLDQFTAVNSAVGNQHAGSLRRNIEQEQWMGLAGSNVTHVRFWPW